MPIVNRGSATAVATDAAAAEKIILTLNPNQDAASGGGVPNLIEGTINVTPGASTTAVVVKCRQGSLIGGTQVGPSLTQTLAAAANGNVAFQFEDAAPVANAGNQYNITVTQTAGAGAGTVNYAYAKVTSIAGVSSS
jgi:hypothetical protein